MRGATWYHFPLPLNESNAKRKNREGNFRPAKPRDRKADRPATELFDSCILV